MEQLPDNRRGLHGLNLSSSERAVRVAAWTWTVVGAVLLAAAAAYLLWEPLAVVLAPLLLAGLIIHLLDPLVSGLARRGVARWIGTAVIYLALALGGVVLLAVCAPLVVAQVSSLVEEAPALRERGAELLNGVGASAGIDVHIGADEDPEAIREEVVRETGQALEDDGSRRRLVALLGGMSGAAAGAARMLLVLALGPVLAFYLLADLPRIRQVARRMVPPARREDTAELMAAMSAVVGGYVRGQLVVALFVGVATSAGLALIGLPFWLIVGVVAGVTNLVPFVGPFIGGALGVAIALLTGGWGVALAVVAVVVVVQQLDSQVVGPLVMRRAVALHPAAVVLALVVAGALYGIGGMLIAVPAVAVTKILAEHLWHRHVPWAEEANRPHGELAHHADGARVDAGATAPVVEDVLSPTS